MTTGRKLRLALGAAILAALFVFVLVGHEPVHGTTSLADPPCAMCGHATESTAPLTLVAPVFVAPHSLGGIAEAPVVRASLSLHRPRGPPLA